MTEPRMPFPLRLEVKADTLEFTHIIQDSAKKYQETTKSWPTELAIHPERGFAKTEMSLVVMLPRPAITPLDGSNDVSGIAYSEATRFIRIKQDETINLAEIVYSGSQQ